MSADIHTYLNQIKSNLCKPVISRMKYCNTRDTIPDEIWDATHLSNPPGCVLAWWSYVIQPLQDCIHHSDVSAVSTPACVQ